MKVQSFTLEIKRVGSILPKKVIDILSMENSQRSVKPTNQRNSLIFVDHGHGK